MAIWYIGCHVLSKLAFETSRIRRTAIKLNIGREEQMKTALSINAVSGALILSLIAIPCAFAQTGPAAATPTPKAAMGEGQGEHKEHHPEIHKAIRKLRVAKEDLEKAAHDYAGHRVKAIQAIDQALAELEQALASDKK